MKYLYIEINLQCTMSHVQLLYYNIPTKLKYRPVLTTKIVLAATYMYMHMHMYMDMYIRMYTQYSPQEKSKVCQE